MKRKKKQLGVFWDEDMLYFLESRAADPHELFYISMEEEREARAQDKTPMPQGLSLVSRIEETLRQKEIVPSGLNLSLPIKDIIFRSFVIPWMQPHEVRGVVEFEIGKYIPFTLDELSYRFHTITITEEKTKRLRIIFVGVKKSTLDHYVNILEQAALNVQIIEPAPLSLLRLLLFRNLIVPEQNLVLIEKGQKAGKIIITNQGVPQFVREFSLKPLTLETKEAADEKSLSIRFVNEMRISLDYFKRQDSQLELNDAIFITIGPEDKLHQNLQDNLNLQIKAVTSESLLAKPHPIVDLGILPAFGVSLADSANMPAAFDLSVKKTRQIRQKISSESRPATLKSCVGTALICLLILGGTFFFSQRSVLDPKQKLNTYNQTLGSYRDSSMKFLEDRKAGLESKLADFKSIRTKSGLTPFLAIIPTLLPEGTWIEKLEISYSDSAGYQKDRQAGRNIPRKAPGKNVPAPVIQLSGYAYLEEKKEQFELVNKFFSKIKEHSLFLDNFDYIELETVEAKRINEYTATYFKIVCQ